MTTTAQLINAIWSSSKAQPTDVSQVAAKHKISDRYAREVLGLMQHHNLLTFDEESFEYTAREDVNALQVQAVLDALGNPDSEAVDATSAEDKVAEVKPKKATTPKKASNLTDCLCGCGDKVGGKANYKPGHDARHAGQVAREIASNYTTKGFDRRKVLAALPSDKLQAKAEQIAENLTAKIDTKKEK